MLESPKFIADVRGLSKLGIPQKDEIVTGTTLRSISG
jgi:hypothetical protein